MTETSSRDLFPGAHEMMILESLCRQQITPFGPRHLEQQISSFNRMFKGISLVLNPAKSPAS